MEPLPKANFSRPIIVISKCLGFAHCRYDGQMVPSPFIDLMKPYVEFIEVCPECEIGLGVPREPIIIVDDGKKRLIQPATGLDLTEGVESFSTSYLEDLDDFDGFILKSRSPSCGIRTTKFFPNPDGSDHLHRKGNGFFADAVLRDYPDLPVIDEEQIVSPLSRGHFLTRVFALASFRDTSLSGRMNNLVEYHTQNKFLFMAYNKQLMTAMGNIVANRDSLSVEGVYEKYLVLLLEILSKPAETSSTINALMHAFGYLSRYLTAGEKFRFMQKLQEYRVDNSTIFEIKEWFLFRAEEFNVEYLSKQTFFCPYPQELSGKFQIV